MTLRRSIARLGAVVLLCAATAHAEPGVGAGAGSAPLATLSFAPGSSALADTDLGEALRWALAHPDGLIVIDGHADPGPPAASGARIALARAKAVRAALIAAGANPHQIILAAFGGARGDRAAVVWGATAPR